VLLNGADEKQVQFPYRKSRGLIVFRNDQQRISKFLE
jgi:hypothetical protein